MSTTRTPDETLYSWFWNTGTGTYCGITSRSNFWQRREDDARDDALGFFDWDQQGHHHRDRLLENARLLATLDVAMADAAIGCWDAKYTYTFWRPITAIRGAADDGNAGNGFRILLWKPLFATPRHFRSIPPGTRA